MSKVALITGITGMDGSHLADFLLGLNYEVHGLVRRHSYADPWRIRHIIDKIHLHPGDLLDQASLCNILSNTQPDEVYNLAAQSFVKDSFEIPLYTSEVTGLGALNLFEAIRGTCSSITKIYQASSSEMFGNASPPHNENSPMEPVSPYGVAKLFAHQMAHVYRQSYGMFIVCGISFNHESERRGPEFVTRKITLAAARIKAGLQDKLELGNITARRDWSYAPDIMRGAWLSLQKDYPDDYVFSSGETHSVGEFIDVAFRTLALDPNSYLSVGSKKYTRPTDVFVLQGDSSKARKNLGWNPTFSFKELVQRMVAYDLASSFVHNSSLSRQN